MSSINSLVNAVNAKGNTPGVMKRWSDQIAAAGGNDNLLQTQVRQQTALLATLNALFSGHRRDDLMLKGGNIYGGLTSDSGLPPTLVSHLSAFNGVDDALYAELGLRAPVGDNGVDTAFRARATSDLDIQISGWESPEAFYDYVRERLASCPDLNARLPTIQEVQEAQATIRALAPGERASRDVYETARILELRENSAGKGLSLKIPTVVAGQKVAVEIQAFITPFPAPDVGLRCMELPSPLAKAVEGMVATRLKAMGATPEQIVAWRDKPGTLESKVEEAVRKAEAAFGPGHNQTVRLREILTDYVPLVKPVPVQAVSLEYMLAEKISIMSRHGEGLASYRQKDYYDAVTILRLAADPGYRARFFPRVNADIEFDPAKMQKAIEHVWKVRGWEPLPTSLADFPGLTQAYPAYVGKDSGKSNADIFDGLCAKFRGREAVPGVDRNLPETVEEIRRCIGELGILPGMTPATPIRLGDIPNTVPPCRPAPVVPGAAAPTPAPQAATPSAAQHAPAAPEPAAATAGLSARFADLVKLVGTKPDPALLASRMGKEDGFARRIVEGFRALANDADVVKTQQGQQSPEGKVAAKAAANARTIAKMAENVVNSAQTAEHASVTMQAAKTISGIVGTLATALPPAPVRDPQAPAPAAKPELVAEPSKKAAKADLNPFTLMGEGLNRMYAGIEDNSLHDWLCGLSRVVSATREGVSLRASVAAALDNPPGGMNKAREVWAKIATKTGVYPPDLDAVMGEMRRTHGIDEATADRKVSDPKVATASCAIVGLLTQDQDDEPGVGAPAIRM